MGHNRNHPKSMAEKRAAMRRKGAEHKAEATHRRYRQYADAANELMEKYPDKFGDRKSNYVDPSDIQADYKSHILEFYHVPTTNSIAFKAYLTDFKDNYQSNWEAIEVYGRMDDIQQFKGTKRSIDVGWQVVAASLEEAMSNLNACSELFKMLYPTYENDTLKAPPLMKLKFGNLIQDVKSQAAGPTPAEYGGLLGIVNGFSLTPDLDAGFFDPGAAMLFPKVIDLSCTFTVLHQETPGWEAGEDDWIGDDAWPYAPESMAGRANINYAHTPAGMRDQEYEEAAANVLAMSGEEAAQLGALGSAASALAGPLGPAVDAAAGNMQAMSYDEYGSAMGTKGTGTGRTSHAPSLGIGTPSGMWHPNGASRAYVAMQASRIDSGTFQGTAEQQQSATELIQRHIGYNERLHSRVELKGKPPMEFNADSDELEVKSED